jgi:RHH-type transcriptional regulator, proline utilization regulon repressor / proline dehydrogenase / delta 1-pyrroline-5-carboxylate dehydrogenase
VVDPVAKLKTAMPKANPHIPLPKDIYGATRKNSAGIDFSHHSEWHALEAGLSAASQKQWLARPTLATVEDYEAPRPVKNPANHSEVVGQVYLAKASFVEKAFTGASEAFFEWSRLAVTERAACLRKAADLLEAKRYDFMWLAVHEAGKTLADANAEVREAVDFCRYYAEQAEQNLMPQPMPGPTGESNVLKLVGRGIVVCVSPWNFPLAIFMGQVTAALVAGNCVLAKPAGQTPLIAALAVKVLHEAGIPEAVAQLVPGSGSTIGQALISDLRTKAVIFTGSTDTAAQINHTLASRGGPIIPLIAETGGQNAMIVDSSALPEQAVADVLSSAFGSAGQRCSALRVLFVQEDIADKLITMLKGAMAELTIAEPQYITTDVGPVIDSAAKKGLDEHKDRMKAAAKLLYEVQPASALPEGTYVLPSAYELPNLSLLTHEVFGPVLHVLRFKADELDQVLQQINNTGFGLTLGIHSRIDSTIDYIVERVQVGNIYVNRNMIGAVVGVQPFGGEGLSGTGPKAGGPHYLLRLVTERTVTVNTTAAGGNASLLMQTDASY